MACMIFQFRPGYGFLEGIFFDEDRAVRKDQLLYTIETEPYEAKVATAQGVLAEANTLLVKAESDLIRIKSLAEQNAVSQSDLDAARLIFEQMLGYANHVGMYSEQIGLSGEALGNTPQAFTHLALISSAFNLDKALG